MNNQIIDWNQPPESIFSQIKKVCERKSRNFDVYCEYFKSEQTLTIDSLYGEHKMVVKLDHLELKLSEQVGQCVVQYIKNNIVLPIIMKNLILNINIIFNTYKPPANFKTQLVEYVDTHIKIKNITELSTTLISHPNATKVDQITFNVYNYDEHYYSTNIHKALDYVYQTYYYNRNKKTKQPFNNDEDVLECYNKAIKTMMLTIKSTINVYETVLILKEQFDQMKHEIVVLKKQNEGLVQTVKEQDIKIKELEQRLSALENKQ